ncbi:hypothetical protein D0T49_00340 [Paludibacter sp. 221]|uniref:hypothetical protein n=1 Tax=Paludibacter sp. 221 TaxID=2302939 RepID=UPI0013D02AC1|nr:hypothetical protein [Paludibacter sp. 221]NDV45501.1 hypothetical protein [Paludibacter sp. 221]
MANDKKTNTKAKAGDTAVQPGTNPNAQPSGTQGATDTNPQENTNQTGQGDSQQGAGKESAPLDTTSKSKTPKTQGNKPASNAKEPKANAEKRTKIANDIFTKNSALNAVYFTSDFLPFGNENDARKHAVTLKDNTVTTISR